MQCYGLDLKCSSKPRALPGGAPGRRLDHAKRGITAALVLGDGIWLEEVGHGLEGCMFSSFNSLLLTTMPQHLFCCDPEPCHLALEPATCAVKPLQTASQNKPLVP